MKWFLVREDSGLKVYLSEEIKVHGIGRARECFIKCQSLYSSRHHCDIICGDDAVSIIDLGSSNGTFLNGKRIAEKTPVTLKENDIIGIGVPMRIDAKSILFKLAIEGNKAPAYHPSVIEDGTRKRNSTSNDDTVPVKISRLDSENALNGSCSSNNLDLSKDRHKNNSIDSISVTLDEPAVVPANTSSLLDSSGNESSGKSSASNLQNFETGEEGNAEVIDLVESDDEGSAPVSKGCNTPETLALVGISEVTSLKKDDFNESLMNKSGYTDENDVIVISDDEDDLFSSSIPITDQSNNAGDEAGSSNQDMGEPVEKELLPVKVWESSDSDESDNEWWPKLSQSFSESIEDHQTKEPEEMQTGSNSGSDGESNADYNALVATHNYEDGIENKPSFEEEQRVESDMWFPVLSQEFDESDDDVKLEEEEMEDIDENVSGEDEGSEEEDYNNIDERESKVNTDLEGDEKDSDSSQNHGPNLKIVEESIVGSAASISECAQVLEKVKISPDNFSSRDKGDGDNFNISGDHIVNETDEHRSGGKKHSHLSVLNLSLANKKGPSLVKAPVLVKGRTCVWDDEGSRENILVPQLPPAPKSSPASAANLKLKNCHVILEDVMYGKNKSKSKLESRLKQSSSRSKVHVKGKEKLEEVLTKEDKKRIKAERKVKLQALSDKTSKEVSPPANSKEVGISNVEDASCSRLHSPTDKVSPSALDTRPGKVAAKITKKNRGAFLTEIDLFASSSTAPTQKGKQPKKSNAEDTKSKKNVRHSENINEKSTPIQLPVPDAFEVEDYKTFQGFYRKEPKHDLQKPGILKPSNKNEEGKKKSVTFDDNVQCLMFLVQPGAKMMPIKGKDYPLLLPPGGGMNVSMLHGPSIKSVVYDICRWNALWLEEQRIKLEPPPVHLDHLITPLLGTYKSFMEYYKCFYPILLHEMWSRIYKEWDQSYTRNPVIQVLLMSQSDVVDGASSEQEFICVHCQCVLSDFDLQNVGCPKVADLVILEFPEENRAAGGGDFYQQNHAPIVNVRVFAYVDAVKRSSITTRVPVNQCFGNIQKNSSLLHVTLKLKKRMQKMCLGQMGRLKVVCPLISELRSFDALVELPKSPLISHILNPLKLDMKTVIPGHFRLKSTESLNPSQKRAVAMAKMVCLAPEPRICLIQGPPGTGKTKVIITLLMEMFGFEGKTLNQQRRNHQTPKILLCAPSNAAIDNVVIKLLGLRTALPRQSPLHGRSNNYNKDFAVVVVAIQRTNVATGSNNNCTADFICSKMEENRFRLVRVGRLESMNPAVRDISLQELTSKEVKNNANNNDIEALEIHISTLRAKLNSILMSIETVKSRNDANQMKTLELKLAEYKQKLEESEQARTNSNSTWSNKDMRNMELMAERVVLQCADIVATTLVSSANNSMMEAFPRKDGLKQHFSCCIIDEACQSLEVDSLIPLKQGISNLVLVGDQQQLFPTVMSTVAKQNGLQTSLFERLWSMLIQGGIPEDISPMVVLNVQYRMHPEICQWPNMHVYQGILKTPDDLVMERQSPFLPYVILSLEFDQNDPNQLLNCNEAELVSRLYFAMHEKTEKRRYSIGIITPYQKQKDIIEGAIMKRKCAMGISCESLCEVNTIDSFQGQERDVVIMSCVRTYSIGFLGEMRRINVALTRARRSLVVCGNFNSLKNHELWNAFLSDGLSRGIVKCLSGNHIPNQRELLNLVSRGSNE